jgi:shikimate kinase
MIKIILIGYMGCGKSLIAKKLSEKLKLNVLDLDDLIENKTQMTIKDIFLHKGELYFRKIENQAFNEILDSNENFILSTGGGTPCYFNNHERLIEFESVYLRASVDTLFERLNKEKSKRPIIEKLNYDDLKEFIGKHLFERSYFYNHAKYKVDVNNKSVNDIVEEIISLL